MRRNFIFIFGCGPSTSINCHRRVPTRPNYDWCWVEVQIRTKHVASGISLALSMRQCWTDEHSAKSPSNSSVNPYDRHQQPVDLRVYALPANFYLWRAAAYRVFQCSWRMMARHYSTRIHNKCINNHPIHSLNMLCP